MGTWRAWAAATMARTLERLSLHWLERVDSPPLKESRGTSQRPPRMSWPPGTDRRLIEREQRGSHYFFTVKDENRAAALEFLRGCELHDRRVWVTVETPEGDLSKHMDMIFEDIDGIIVELPD